MSKYSHLWDQEVMEVKIKEIKKREEQEKMRSAQSNVTVNPEVDDVIIPLIISMLTERPLSKILICSTLDYYSYKDPNIKKEYTITHKYPQKDSVKYYIDDLDRVYDILDSLIPNLEFKDIDWNPYGRCIHLNEDFIYKL